jgi:hypothetical protein
MWLGFLKTKKTSFSGQNPPDLTEKCRNGTLTGRVGFVYLSAEMLTQPESHSDLSTRRQIAESINQALTRFPMILEILGELGKARIPFPGDDDIRHGCERALTTMLSELARIQPAPSGRVSKAEELARSWPLCESASVRIDPDQLQRIQQFIDRILGDSPPSK